MGMSLEPISNQPHILRAYLPPLNDQWLVHWPNEYLKPATEARK